MGKKNTAKQELLDERIESFCQGSIDLLTNIHERCSKPDKKSKRGRKKKKQDVDIPMDVEDWDKELV